MTPYIVEGTDKLEDLSVDDVNRTDLPQQAFHAEDVEQYLDNNLQLFPGQPPAAATTTTTKKTTTTTARKRCRSKMRRQAQRRLTNRKRSSALCPQARQEQFHVAPGRLDVLQQHFHALQRRQR